ncbi:thioredoxin-like protein [Tribonema minus]|uniref:Thioredoxin-like protein n=1 Tax=Tribonema minus TaxID=303371 RepID=A0A836CIN0_9STRA|nr:thioredoxin-like protein [Tribonema minus]
MLAFTASWCKHCKVLAPIWQTVAEELDGQVSFASIDGWENRALSRRFHVAGFPTIFFVDARGDVYAFAGTASVTTLKAFALGGYRDAAKLSSAGAPFGLRGTVKGLLIRWGAQGQALYGDLLAAGVPRWAALLGFTLCGLLVTLLLVLLGLQFQTREHLD